MQQPRCRPRGYAAEGGGGEDETKQERAPARRQARKRSGACRDCLLETWPAARVRASPQRRPREPGARIGRAPRASADVGPESRLARPGAVARAENGMAQRAVVDRLGEAGVEAAL